MLRGCSVISMARAFTFYVIFILFLLCDQEKEQARAEDYGLYLMMSFKTSTSSSKL